MTGDAAELKEIQFFGSSLDDLRDFPEGARRDAGFQLDRVQHGEEPDDWRPFAQVGPGTREIRIADRGDAYRVMYVVKFEDRVHVLHCFEKKTQKTAKKDIELAKTRYTALKREYGK